MSKSQYLRNLRLIQLLAGLNAASFFVPLAVPFWLGQGLNQKSIYLLQGSFTLALLVLEVPTGMLADRIGRRRTLMLSGSIATGGFVVYGLAHGFWQFVAAEVLLAAGLALNSGTLSAMRHETVLAIGNDQGRSSAGRTHSAALIGGALTAALSGVSLKLGGYRFAMLCDALTYLVAVYFASRMVEPPHQQAEVKQKIGLRQMKRTLMPLAGMIVFFALLREITQIPVFLNARVLDLAGVKVVWFGAIFAGLQLVSAAVSRYGHRLEEKMGESWTAKLLALLPITSYLWVALTPVWASPLGLIGLSVMYGLAAPFIGHMLNSAVQDDRIRATVNSYGSLVARALYLVAGPVVGGVVDSHGVQSAFGWTGLAFGLALVLSLVWFQRRR